MSALDWLDRAFALTRRAGVGLRGRAWLAGAPLAFLTVFVFYLERVEGVRSVRGILALGLGLAWWWRTHWLGRASRRAMEDLDAPLEVAPGPVGTLALAGVAGAVLALALMPAALLARGGAPGLVVGAVLALPVALLAPSWVARAATGAPQGAGAWMTAFRDAATLRGSALLVHGFLLVGTLMLFVNLLAVAGMLLSALQGLLGVEVAALASFMSFENDFAMVVVAVVALWVAEPLRAALAVIALLHARSRRDGADLRRLVGALASSDAAPGRASDRRHHGRAAISLVCFMVSAQPARAQAPLEPYSEVPADAPLADPVAPTDDAYVADPHEGAIYYGADLPALGADDQATEDRVATILSGPAFREFSDASEGGGTSDDGPSWLTRLFEALMRWLEDRQQDEASGAEMGAPMPLPPAWVFVALALALLVAVAAFLLISRRKDEQLGPLGPDAQGAPVDPRERAPEEHLDEAAQLAARGLHREAFRSLYLATLVALDRRGEIDFDPARTNWHYLRQMGASARTGAFRTFTQLFDRKWYGDEHTTREEYERGRALATSLTAPREDRPTAGFEPEGAAT